MGEVSTNSLGSGGGSFIELRRSDGEIARFRKLSDGNETLGEALMASFDVRDLLPAVGANLAKMQASMGIASEMLVSNMLQPHLKVADALRTNPALQALTGFQGIPEALAASLRVYESFAASASKFQVDYMPQVVHASELMNSFAALLPTSNWESIAAATMPHSSIATPSARVSSAPSIIVPANEIESLVITGEWSPIVNRGGRPPVATWSEADIERKIIEFLATHDHEAQMLKNFLKFANIHSRTWARLTKRYNKPWSTWLRMLQ